MQPPKATPKQPTPRRPSVQRHVAFWIGFFAASLVIVPIAIGVWGLAEDMAELWVVFLYGAIATLVGIAVLAILFRDRVMTWLLGRADASLEEVSSRLVSTIAAAVRGDHKGAEEEGKVLAAVLAGWWAWSNLYRWVIGSALGLLVAFGAFVGTVLLFEQNRKLGQQTTALETQTKALETQTTRLGEQTAFMEAQTKLMQTQTDRLEDQAEQATMQNEILTLSLVNELRSQFLVSVREVNFAKALLPQTTLPETGEVLWNTEKTCGLRMNPTVTLQTAPSNAIIEEVARLSREGALAPRVRAALRILLKDREPAVVYGAAKALDLTGDQINGEIELNGLYAEKIDFRNAQQLSIRDSFLREINCPDCGVRLSGGFFGSIYRVDFVDGAGFVVAGPIGEDVRINSFAGIGMVLFFSSDDAVDLRWQSFEGLFGEFGRVRIQSLFMGDTQSLCRAFESISDSNPLFNYFSTDTAGE